mmetsp:Transcript_102855/g.162380  ORF Transcript_102855/g.162380 Transcript_102855/m.162380 type:complete len:391 (+) Transcript_102855:45-1217(+)
MAIISDACLPKHSPLVGFIRHSPQLKERADLDACCQKQREPLKLPATSPYVGSHRHAPPSPMLHFTNPKRHGYEELEGSLPFFVKEMGIGDGFFLPASIRNSSTCTLQGHDEVWALVFSMYVELPYIGALAALARGFSSILKSEWLWAGRPVVVPPSLLAALAPVLSEWLPAWKKASKLVLPKSAQLATQISTKAPDLPVEIAWRFDSHFKGNGVEVVNHGRTVRRIDGADEDLVVLGDAPLTSRPNNFTFFEVALDDRSMDVGDSDFINDFGIGVTACPPSEMDELGSVADEVPLSWVVDFTSASVILSVDNSEAARGKNLSARELAQGDRVGLRMTETGSVEVLLNGRIREHLVPPLGKRVPAGVPLYPVLDLYGCTTQLSRTDADFL